MFNDLRSFIDVLGERKLLRRVRAEVDWDLEVGAIQRRVFDREGPALFFERVRGYEWPLVSGVLGTAERYALALGCEPHKRSIIRKVEAAAAEPLPPVVVESGLCQENVDTGAAINVLKFPVPQWHRLDGGRYIGTLGLVITKDPDTGAQNVGIYREQVLDRNRLGLNATQQVGTL